MTQPGNLIPMQAISSSVTSGSDGDIVTNQAHSAGIVIGNSVAENVTSFLSGIRASFRQDNVNVTSGIRPSRNVSKTQIPNQDGYFFR